MALVKRKMVCEIEFPDDFDTCYDKLGIQAFHDTITVAVAAWATEYCAMFKIGSGENTPSFDHHCKTKLQIMKSLNVVGIIDQNNEYITWDKETDTFGVPDEQV